MGSLSQKEEATTLDIDFFFFLLVLSWKTLTVMFLLVRMRGSRSSLAEDGEKGFDKEI